MSFLRTLCRKRQLRHNVGEQVTFRNSRIKATVAASRWNAKSSCWEYHLEGFPGWTKQNLIK
jgi:hypothetical protein